MTCHNYKDAVNQILATQIKIISVCVFRNKLSTTKVVNLKLILALKAFFGMFASL